MLFPVEELPEWHPPYEMVCALSHFAWGGWFIFIGWLFATRWKGLVVLVVWLILKDMAFDLTIERGEFWEEMEDVACYLGGAMTILILIYVSDKWKGRTYSKD